MQCNNAFHFYFYPMKSGNFNAVKWPNHTRGTDSLNTSCMVAITINGRLAPLGQVEDTTVWKKLIWVITPSFVISDLWIFRYLLWFNSLLVPIILWVVAAVDLNIQEYCGTCRPMPIRKWHLKKSYEDKPWFLLLYPGCKPKKTCPEGQVYTNGSFTECVPRAKCRPLCMTLEDGREILEGEIIEEDACHTCRCSKKHKVCTGQPCSTEVSQL